MLDKKNKKDIKVMLDINFMLDLNQIIDISVLKSPGKKQERGGLHSSFKTPLMN